MIYCAFNINSHFVSFLFYVKSGYFPRTCLSNYKCSHFLFICYFSITYQYHLTNIFHYCKPVLPPLSSKLSTGKKQNIAMTMAISNSVVSKGCLTQPRFLQLWQPDSFGHLKLNLSKPLIVYQIDSILDFSVFFFFYFFSFIHSMISGIYSCTCFLLIRTDRHLALVVVSIFKET